MFALTVSRQQSGHASDCGLRSSLIMQAQKSNLACVSYLGPELLYFRRQLLALLRVLPLGRFFALDDLKEVQVLLLQLLLLQQQFVEAENRCK